MSERKRLEYLRGELRAERISYGELAELQSLVNYIDEDDVELLEAAGVPEDDRPTILGFVDYLNTYIEEEVDRGALLSEACDLDTLRRAADAYLGGAR